MPPNPPDAMPPNNNPRFDLHIHFKWILLSAVGLTFIALLMMFVISFFESTDTRKQVLNTCDTIAKLGAGAVIGLLGGKVTK